MGAFFFLAGLQGPQIGDEIEDLLAHRRFLIVVAPEVLEADAPDRHLAGTVAGDLLAAVDRPIDALGGELAAVLRGQTREIGGNDLEQLGHRSVAVARAAVAVQAVEPVAQRAEPHAVLYRRGFTFFLIYAGLLALAINVDDHERAFFIPCTVFFFFFNIFDAYRQATLINYGYAAAPADDKSVFDNLSNWGLIPGVALVVLGLYGLFRRYFDIDLSWVLDQWPYAIIAFGGWMIYQAIQQRQDTEGGGIEV